MAKQIDWDQTLIDIYDGEPMRRPKISRVDGRTVVENGQPVIETPTLRQFVTEALLNVMTDPNGQPVTGSVKNTRYELVQEIKNGCGLRKQEIEDIKKVIGQAHAAPVVGAIYAILDAAPDAPEPGEPDPVEKKPH